MPPPSPYNVNRWMVIGTVVLVGGGYLASRGRRPALELARVGSAPSASPSVAASDAGRKMSPEEARFSACFDGVAARAERESPTMKALAELNVRARSPIGQRLSFAEAAAECEKLAAALPPSP